MSVKPILPPAALAQHVAVLGKTGSGKTSTGKLIIEHVAAEGARVCILDPIKSDWWGMTSSADGKKPGLPFHILGGPRGHVPLHAQAGKAIGEIVATGALPLSIVDMAEFGPGDHMRFFCDFAQALLRKMRGVLYLVIEEAHEFAPKERSGIGAENMGIYWAKKIATAGRSKGIRMMVLTQRTQSLHNALLGSCETVIAHRLTAPADQKPVLDWLKANASAGIQQMVSAQLASLKTGAGWLCSGEAGIFERRDFPRIRTYDNSATPEHDSAEHQVKTAPVDADKLRAIIGDAVKDAEANDPRLLRAEIQRLKTEAARASKAPAADPDAEFRGYERGYAEAYSNLENALLAARDALGTIVASAGRAEQEINAVGAAHEPAPAATQPRQRTAAAPPKLQRKPAISAGPGQPMGKAERLALTALAQYPDGRTKAQVAILAGYAVNGGGFNNALSALRTRGWIEGSGDRLKATEAGIAALGNFQPLPTGEALLQHWMGQLGKAERAILGTLVEAYPGSMEKVPLAEECGYEAGGGGFNNALSRLRTLELIEGRGELRASDSLFD